MPQLLPAALRARLRRDDRDGLELPAGARTVSSYFHAFGPAPAWDDLGWWPPDVFALTNLVLDHTEAYRFVIAPPAGRRWPPATDWNLQVRGAARAWRAAVAEQGAELPSLVRRGWETVTRQRTTELAAIRTGEAWESER